MISPSDIKYFIEAARTRHVSRAAERLGITQPALSHSIRKIEREIGHRIFLRSKKGVVLTAAGERLFERAQELLQSWELLMHSIQDEIETVSGLIRLGCHTAVAQYSLPGILPQFLQDHPLVKVQLTHGLSRHMAEQVVSSRLDVAIVVNPMPHLDIIVREICRDTVTVWQSRNCLNPELLMMEPDLLQTQDLILRMKRKKFCYTRVLESSSMEVLAQLLVAGTGRAILPARVVKALANSKIEPVKDAPIYEDRVCLVYKPEFKKLKRGAVFIQRLSEIFRGTEKQ